MSEEIRMDGNYKTKSGHSVKILSVDTPGPYPVVAVVLRDGAGIPYSFTASGLFLSNLTHAYDLVSVPEPIPDGVCYRKIGANFFLISNGLPLCRSEFRNGPSNAFDYEKWAPRASEFPTYDSVFGKKPIDAGVLNEESLVKIGDSLYFVFSANEKRVVLANARHGLLPLSYGDLFLQDAKHSSDLGETWKPCHQ